MALHGRKTIRIVVKTNIIKIHRESVIEYFVGSGRRF